MRPKTNLTVRLDDMLRDKLEFIAEREIRPLANQVLFFITNAVNAYLSNSSVHEDYLSHLNARAMLESSKKQKQDSQSDISLPDIPF